MPIRKACCAPVLTGRLDSAEADELAGVFRALGDPGRLRLLSFLAAQPGGEACVCHLTEPLGLSQPTVSHHLKVLTDAGLLERERRGTWMYYRLRLGKLEELCDALVPPEEALERDAAASHAVTRARRAAAEAVGTALLLATVVGSGIMGERLAGGNVAIALLANSTATGAALVALILTFGAAMNPLVTLAAAARRTLPWIDVPALLLAQIVGAIIGVVAANVMFELPALQVSTHARSGAAQLLSEVVATFGLLLVAIRAREPALAVGGYIAAAYWFTASTSFANPAVTVARALSDTFAGIRPADVGGFVAAQFVGAVAATWFCAWLGGDDG